MNYTHESFDIATTGLLDVPICAVHDEGYFTNPRLRRRPATAEARGMYTFRIPKPTKEVYNLNPTINASQYPTNTLTGLSMFPQGFREKTHAPMFGLSMFPLCGLFYVPFVESHDCSSSFSFDTPQRHTPRLTCPTHDHTPSIKATLYQCQLAHR